jgi:hypothetical protein
MTNTQYQSPTLTDLGSVEDLTQLTISIKSTKNGTDVHFAKTGVTEVPGKRGVSFDINNS